MSQNIAGFVQNQITIRSPIFLKACELAGIQPTPRQASKWNNGYGKALTFRNRAKAELRATEEAAAANV